MAEIILSSHFLQSPVWWPYIQSVINMDFINGCVNVISRTVIYLYLFLLTNLRTLREIPRLNKVMQ